MIPFLSLLTQWTDKELSAGPALHARPLQHVTV